MTFVAINNNGAICWTFCDAELLQPSLNLNKFASFFSFLALRCSAFIHLIILARVGRWLAVFFFLDGHLIYLHLHLLCLYRMIHIFDIEPKSPEYIYRRDFEETPCPLSKRYVRSYMKERHIGLH